MDFTCIFFGILFTLAGLCFAFGKGYLHLSLWKNMPQKEKDKLRIIPLCRYKCKEHEESFTISVRFVKVIRGGLRNGKN